MTERRPMMAGNWKMNHTHFDAIQVVQKLGFRLEKADFERVEVVICPAFTALRSVQTTVDADRLDIGLGAQDCHWEEKGAFTGEVSPVMLAKLDVAYVIVGHSERRQMFGDTDEVVALKLRAVLGAGMAPILCCGETLEEREADTTEAIVRGQISAALAGLAEADARRCVVAYEPIWAIGTGRTASPEDADTVIGTIRDEVARVAGRPVADGMRILYGGSVNPGNVASLMAMPQIDGGLVGGASLDPDDFARLVRYGAT